MALSSIFNNSHPVAQSLQDGQTVVGGNGNHQLSRPDGLYVDDDDDDQTIYVGASSIRQRTIRRDQFVAINSSHSILSRSVRRK